MHFSTLRIWIVCHHYQDQKHQHPNEYSVYLSSVVVKCNSKCPAPESVNRLHLNVLSFSGEVENKRLSCTRISSGSVREEPRTVILWESLFGLGRQNSPEAVDVLPAHLSPIRGTSIELCRRGKREQLKISCQQTCLRDISTPTYCGTSISRVHGSAPAKRTNTVFYLFGTYQSITVHPFAFMKPKTDQLLSLHKVGRMCLEQALEDIGEVPHIELVVEICRRFTERVAHLMRDERGSCQDRERRQEH